MAFPSSLALQPFSCLGGSFYVFVSLELFSSSGNYRTPEVSATWNAHSEPYWIISWPISLLFYFLKMGDKFVYRSWAGWCQPKGGLYSQASNTVGGLSWVKLYSYTNAEGSY